MRLHSRRVAVLDLGPRDRRKMFALFERHFERVDHDRFEADLAKKQWVIQLLDPSTGELRGFSAQVLLRAPMENREVNVLYSGDTIVDPACWGETALMREWGKLAMELADAVSPDSLYWFLISKGYKTYRFLPVFFREFYPRYDREAPDWARTMLGSLGRSLFADAYDARREVVIATPHKDRLRAGVADVTRKRTEDPHVRYFLERNPGHCQGDELCCLAPVDVANFTPAGLRLLAPEHRRRHLARSRA